MCGDGVIEGDEACDDGNAVDEDLCTNACASPSCGDGIQSIGEACDDGNAVDNDGCSLACLLASCGDGAVQVGEVCDGGGETKLCNENCTLAACGDGIVNPTAGEECDDFGESPSCDLDCSAAVCGDGIVNAALLEQCDGAGETKSCDADCSAALCGDGTVNATAGELCDDTGDSKFCDADCTPAACGDGVVNAVAGESCDAAGETAACDADCTPAVCGDGVINLAAGESCDDGNMSGGDGCSVVCKPTSQVVAGYGHVCVILGDGSVRCWGSGSSGALGYGNKASLGDAPNELPLQPVNVGGKVIQMDLGADHSCALLSTGKVRCWGSGDQGQLGQGNKKYLGDDPGEMPVPDVVLAPKVLQIATGGRHTCAIVEDKSVRCWGFGSYGQLGYNNSTTLLAPLAQDVPGMYMVKQLSLGLEFSCALTEAGAVKCWGLGVYGMLGNGSTAAVGDGPNEVPPAASMVGSQGDPVVRIAAGHQHACGLLASGKVRCWGYNFDKQLGPSPKDVVGDEPGEMPPANVNLGAMAAVQVVAGSRHTCALMANKKVKCWGASPEEGYPGGSNLFPPPDVDVGGDVVMLASHMGKFTCALLVDDSVRCWGFNNYGQLGHGHTNSIGDDETPASAGPVPY
jgi:cysteine-rich repeat protein